MGTSVVAAGTRAGLVGGLLAVALVIFEQIPVVLDASLTTLLVVFGLTLVGYVLAFLLIGAVAANLAGRDGVTTRRSIGAAIIAAIVMMILAGVATLVIGSATYLLTGGYDLVSKLPADQLASLRRQGFDPAALATNEGATFLMIASLLGWVAGTIAAIVVNVVGALLYASRSGRRVAGNEQTITS